MPTTFYLRNITAANPPTAGEKSTALPVDTLGANKATGTDETRSLDTAKGAAQASIAKDSDSTTAARHNYLCRFTSASLAAQTIAAATWTIAIALAEANVNANSFLNLSLYAWRPSTSAVVAFVYDSATNIGAEWGATEDGQVITFSGVAVTTALNDVLVLEVWRRATQGMAAIYTQTVYFNGATDVIDTTTTDAASYLQNPNVITFGVQTFNQTLTTTAVTSSASRRLQVNKSLSATAVTSAATRQLQVNKIVSSSVVGSTASLVKEARKALTASLVSTVATMSRVLTFGRVLTADVSTTAATMQRSLTFARTATATAVTSTVSLVKSVQKALSTNVVISAGSTLKEVQKLLTASLSTSTVTMSRITTFVRTLTSNLVVATASMQRGLSLGRTLTATAVSATATMSRAVTFVRSLSATAVSSTVILRRHRSFGLPFLFTAANWSGTASFFLEVFLRAEAGTARARLYNITDGVVVANSELSTTSTSYVRLRSVALTLADGRTYAVQFGSDNIDSGAFRGAKLIVV